MNVLRAFLVAAAAAAASYLAIELVRLAQERWGADLEVRARGAFDEILARARLEDEVQRALPQLHWEVWQALEEADS